MISVSPCFLVVQNGERNVSVTSNLAQSHGLQVAVFRDNPLQCVPQLLESKHRIRLVLYWVRTITQQER